MKTDSIRELAAVNTSALTSKVQLISEAVWERETTERENSFDCFNDTQHIIFRFPFDLRDRTNIDDKPAWSVWKPLLLPIIQAAIAPYNYADGQLGAVMLAKLKAGGEISKHTDGSPSYYFTHKIHVPLITSPEVRLYIEPETYHLEEGIAYEVNNIAPHAVSNAGSIDRVHLIFEYFSRSMVPNEK